MSDNISYYEKVKDENAAIKYAVACEAFKKCKPKDSVFIDAGTSLTPIAELFVAKSSLFPNQVYNTILTNNYFAFKTLIDNLPSETHINIMLTGGRYDRNLKALYGSQAKKSLDSFYPAVVFIGLSGLIAEIGLFCQGNTEELDMKEVIYKKGTRDRVIIADSSKVGRVDSMCFGMAPFYKANATEDTYILCERPRNKHLLTRYSREMSILKDTFDVKVEDIKDDIILLCHKYFTKTTIYSKTKLTESNKYETLSLDFFSCMTPGGVRNVPFDRNKCEVTYNLKLEDGVYIDIFSGDVFDNIMDFTEQAKVKAAKAGEVEKDGEIDKSAEIEKEERYEYDGKNGNDSKSIRCIIINKYIGLYEKMKAGNSSSEILKHKDKEITYIVFHSLNTDFESFILKKINNDENYYLLNNNEDFVIGAHEDWWQQLVNYCNYMQRKLANNTVLYTMKLINCISNAFCSSNTEKIAQDIQTSETKSEDLRELVNDLNDNIKKLNNCNQTLKEKIGIQIKELANQDTVMAITNENINKLKSIIEKTKDLVKSVIDEDISHVRDLNKDFQSLLNINSDIIPLTYPFLEK